MNTQHISNITMESSGISEPVSLGHEEPEESTWTEILVDFSNERRREIEGRREDEDEEDEISHGDDCMSASMISDAGSGPEWKLRNCGNKSDLPKKLNMKRAKEISYDDDLEDTASSPVNSPKITSGFKRMDINCRRTFETFDPYHFQGKGRAIEDQQGKDEEMKTTTIDGRVEKLADMGLSLVPLTMLMNFNYYHHQR